jgi:hypothetical protein
MFLKLTSFLAMGKDILLWGLQRIKHGSTLYFSIWNFFFFVVQLYDVSLTKSGNVYVPDEQIICNIDCAIAQLWRKSIYMQKNLPNHTRAKFLGDHINRWINLILHTKILVWCTIKMPCFMIIFGWFVFRFQYVYAFGWWVIMNYLGWYSWYDDEHLWLYDVYLGPFSQFKHNHFEHLNSK